MDKIGSIIDYPRLGLDQSIWSATDTSIDLQPEIRKDVEEIVASFLDDLDLPKEALIDVLIYGSLLTNQYNSKTDMDARILLDPEVISKYYPDVSGDELYSLTKENIHNIQLGTTKHPFNATVVIKGEKTELGKADLGITEKDPVFSLRDSDIVNFGEWYSSEFDPDEEFSEETSKAKEIMERLDKLIQDAKSDTIDIELLKDAVGDVEDPQKIITKIEQKVQELTETVSTLAEHYIELRDKRTEGYKSTPPGEDHHKAPENIIYKILEKYRYIDLLKKLKAIAENGVQESEVEDVAEVLQVEGAVDVWPIPGVSPTAPPLSPNDMPAPTELQPNAIPDGGMMHGASCPHCGYVNPLTAATGDEITCQSCEKKFEVDGFTLNTAPSTEQYTTPYESDVPIYSKLARLNVSQDDMNVLETVLKDTGVSPEVINQFKTKMNNPDAVQQSTVAPTEAPESAKSPVPVQGPGTTEQNDTAMNKTTPTLKDNKVTMKPMKDLTKVMGASKIRVNGEYKQRGMDFYAAVLKEMSENNKIRVQWYSSKQNFGHTSYATLSAAKNDIIAELGNELEDAVGSMDKFVLNW